MSRIHIVSNRLPFSINVDKENIDLIPSVGGLATGMRSVYKEYNGKWIGWPGLPSDDIDENLSNKIDEELEKEDCVPVHLSKEEVDLYYDGFSNRTIWPLFHYFAQYIDYDPKLWDSFVSVNQKFADKALETLEEGDTIWIHDYQLLLVPEMIKSKRPGVTVGFFLHIPFPSFEVFRIYHGVKS